MIIKKPNYKNIIKQNLEAFMYEFGIRNKTIAMDVLLMRSKTLFYIEHQEFFKDGLYIEILREIIQEEQNNKKGKGDKQCQQ